MKLSVQIACAIVGEWNFKSFGDDSWQFLLYSLSTHDDPERSDGSKTVLLGTLQGRSRHDRSSLLPAREELSVLLSVLKPRLGAHEVSTWNAL